MTRCPVPTIVYMEHSKKCAQASIFIFFLSIFCRNMAPIFSAHKNGANNGDR